MNRNMTKLKAVFIPFLLTFVGLMIGYTFFHWLLFIRLSFFPLKPLLTDLAFPITLTGLLIGCFLHPKLKVLNLESKHGSSRHFYSYIAWLLLAVPLVILQHYMVTATGQLNEISSVNEINRVATTKYYTLEKQYIDKKISSVYSRSYNGRGKNAVFYVELYRVLPIFENENDVQTNRASAWLGFKYRKRISRRLSPEEQQKRINEFIDKSQKDFERKDFSRFVYFDRIGNSDDKNYYALAVQKMRYRLDPTILVGVDQPFEQRNGKKSYWFLATSFCGLLVWLLMVLLAPLAGQGQREEVEIDRPPAKTPKNSEWLNIFVGQKGYQVTPVLLYLNVSVLFWIFLDNFNFVVYDGRNLFNWGANYGPFLRDGEWWRFFTHLFLSGSLVHLLVNMVGLYYIGILLEPLLGAIKYMLVLVLTGILASLASMGWYHAAVSVGMSGAVFGLYGVFLVLLLKKVYLQKLTTWFLVAAAVFVSFNLVMGFVGAADNVAHIGGFLSGCVIGLILYYIPHQHENAGLGARILENDNHVPS